MLYLRLTVLGILISYVATLYVADLPIAWSLAVFVVLAILSGRSVLVGAMLLPFVSLLVISGVYEFARSSAIPTLSYFLSQSHKPYVLMFSYVFIPGLYLSAQINLYDILPVGSSSRGALRTFRLTFIQLLHRRAALIRRAQEIFGTLELRGFNTAHALGRIRNAHLWVPVLASTAFVEALEAIEYERMMQLDLDKYAGLFRRGSANRLHECTLDLLNLCLLVVVVRYVFVAR